MATIKLILADDHEMVRSGIRMLLESKTDIEIIGEAKTGSETVELVRTLKPDIVLMDIQMPDMNGIEATRQIRELVPDVAILALTMHEDDQYFFEMLNAGASGYVPKRAAPDELITGIRTVFKGQVYLYPTLAKKLVKEYLQRSEGTDAQEADVLTKREKEVLIQIAEGLTNQQIASKLFISEKTVDRHRENTMRKLNLHSRIELVKYALKKGLIDLDN